MSQSHNSLSATTRTEHGNLVAKFRFQGKLPVVVYGDGKQNISAWVEAGAFEKVYKTAGNTGVIDLMIEDKKVPVIIKTVDEHPLKKMLVHVDFLRVNLKKPITAEVPVTITGTESSPAVKAGGVLITIDENVFVEALPDNMPHELVVDVSTVEEIGTQIKVKDLPRNGAYTIKDDDERLLYQIIAHKEESLEADTASAETEVITQKKEDTEEAAKEE